MNFMRRKTELPATSPDIGEQQTKAAREVEKAAERLGAAIGFLGEDGVFAEYLADVAADLVAKAKRIKAYAEGGK